MLLRLFMSDTFVALLCVQIKKWGDHRYNPLSLLKESCRISTISQEAKCRFPGYMFKSRVYLKFMIDDLDVPEVFI